MTIGVYLKTYWDDLKAWRRGETRIAPRGVTGRIYARKRGDSDGLAPVHTAGDCIISAKVYRAATGRWEELGVISKGKVTKG